MEFTDNESIVLCYYCGSAHIRETTYGSVCTSCGTDQELTRIERNKIQEQNYSLNMTTMGTEGERKMSTNKMKILYLSKLDSIKTYNNKTMMVAFTLTKTMLEKLGRSNKEIRIILKKFEDVRTQFPASSKFQNPKKLIPFIIYFYFKELNIVIDIKTLFENSEISKKEFNAFRIHMERFWSAYKVRDRYKYICTRIGGVIGYGRVYNQSIKLLKKFWNLIRDSKDDVIAGLVTGIVIILSKCEDRTMKSICKEFNISQSSLQKSIQNKLFNRLGIKDNVKGFRKKVEFLEERGFFRVT